MPALMWEWRSLRLPVWHLRCKLCECGSMFRLQMEYGSLYLHPHPVWQLQVKL